jgi:hypothetical protein
MEGKVALEQHFSTELNNWHWSAKSEEERNGKTYAQDVERRLLDPERARWFDDMGLENSKTRLMGRENADLLFSLNLGSPPTSAVAGFAS